MYVYSLESTTDPTKYYVGRTKDIDTRLATHNRGEVGHTKKYIPWKLVFVIWFEDKTKAHAFERYLKSGSGRAFAKRHF